MHILLGSFHSACLPISLSSNLLLILLFLSEQNLAARQPLDLVKHAVEEGLFDVLRQQASHIEGADHYIFQEWYEEAKDLAVHVVIPGLDPDSVRWGRVVEVFGKVVYYDGFREVSAKIS
jgi:hypothetical protein